MPAGVLKPSDFVFLGSLRSVVLRLLSFAEPARPVYLFPGNESGGTFIGEIYAEIRVARRRLYHLAGALGRRGRRKARILQKG